METPVGERRTRSASSVTRATASRSAALQARLRPAKVIAQYALSLVAAS
jgi:hypothetical protein